MRLVERDRELAAVRALVNEASRRLGGLLMFEGPSGVGKSALLAELAARAGDAGVSVASVRATRLGGESPFSVARRLLEPAVRARPSVLEAGWARHARSLFDGEPGGAGIASSLVEGLVALAAQLVDSAGSLVLVVDDAQWADPSSLAFLKEVVDRGEEPGAGVAVAIRTAEPGIDARSLRRLGAAAGARVLTPAPLSAGAVCELVMARLPEVDRAYAIRLAEASGGNPLLVAELLDSAERHPGAQLPIPEGLGRTVLLRLDDVGPEARALAEAVAVLTEAPLRRAAALAGLFDRVADAAGDELVVRHVLAAGHPVRFEQPIVGDALSATIAPFELADRHRRAAELLAADGEDADQVAAHLMVSRPGAERWVCDALRRAASAALDRGDPAAATQLLERAVAEPPAAEDRGAVLVELAGARAAAGQPAAIDAFEDALAHVKDRVERAQAWHGLSRLLYARGDYAGAAAAGAHGRAELPEDHPLGERLLSDELAGARRVPETTADAAARLDGLAAGEPPADPMLLAQVVAEQAWRGGRVERVPELAQRACAADPLIDPESRGAALTFVAGALAFIDETVKATEILDRGLERVAELGDPLAEVNLRCTRAWSLIYRGQLNLAAQDLDAVLAINELGWPFVDALCAPPLVVLRLELGDLEGARDALHRSPSGANPGYGWFEGAVALAAGNAAVALTAFEAAGAELEGMLGVANPGVLPWRSGAALAAAQLDDLAKARSLVAVEVDQARAVGAPRALGIALRTAGLVGDDPRRVEESVDVLERSPARLELARSLMYAGIWRRRAGRAQEARNTLSRALELAVECGASALAQRALTELNAAGARPRHRPSSGVRALTASERQVAELAAAGRTTRQVAAVLFLSPKTVEGHLTNAYRKLRISSRTELEPLLRPSEEVAGGSRQLHAWRD
jgi:DNA-binding CsgD family transcriptional regulator